MEQSRHYLLLWPLEAALAEDESPGMSQEAKGSELGVRVRRLPQKKTGRDSYITINSDDRVVIGYPEHVHNCLPVFQRGWAREGVLTGLIRRTRLRGVRDLPPPFSSKPAHRGGLGQGTQSFSLSQA